MAHLAQFGGYPLYVIVLAAVAAVIGGGIAGQLTDAVMGDAGFGAFGNAVLTILGVFIGVYVRTALFGRLYSKDLIVTSVFAAAAATAILLILGVVKHFMQD